MSKLLASLLPVMLAFDSMSHQPLHSGNKKWSETIDIEKEYQNMLEHPEQYLPWQRAVLKKKHYLKKVSN